ncbi:hypothetical protein TCON_0198 [Astathelohania contejeani]|uniref:Uncharacterized protein n=1 Tax=Astathelohania contejeani TaxID=164912 RepID=A0ABQ7I2D8_9MICR|nr:hypothetical protein TCON_0198 [Thelohania contejeani]
MNYIKLIIVFLLGIYCNHIVQTNTLHNAAAKGLTYIPSVPQISPQAPLPPPPPPPGCYYTYKIGIQPVLNCPQPILPPLTSTTSVPPATPVYSVPTLNSMLKQEPQLISPLSRAIAINPEIGHQIKQILLYGGILPPWDPIKDLLDTGHQKLPDPCGLYIQIRDFLKVFESFRELISDQLLNIEIFVKRGKNYLKEYCDKLTRSFSKLKRYLKKIKCSKFPSIKAEYAKKFNDLNQQTQMDLQAYKCLKQWKDQMKAQFKQLF